MPSKRQSQRPSKGQPSTRSRTRSSKAILYDPAQNTELLNQQLHALGLYAAHTIGDGNCLFRALSDQLYGTPNFHLRLRDEICDWIASRKDRYAPFVDDERGLDVHLRCMRTPGTYGGHLELSAFAHCKRRNVKVIQPGLVYIIEWSTGVDDDGDPASSPNGDADDRDRRRLRRTKEKGAKAAAAPEPDEEAQGTIYVAYHDWEHFSSVRNISGPHNGIPNVVESVPPPDSSHADLHAPASKHKAKQALKTPKRVTRAASASAKAATASTSGPLSQRAPSPADIPLPPSPESRSRASSPATQLSTSSVATASTAPSSIQTPPPSSAGQRRVHLRLRPPSGREGRSPKRSFEESERDDPDSNVEQEARKRQRQNSKPDAEMDVEDGDGDGDGGAFSDTSSLSSLSDMDGAVSEADSSPPPPTPPPAASRPLTRRQRKALGLPKIRSALVGGSATGTGTKIKIPGGKFRAAAAAAAAAAAKENTAAEAKSSEWQSNGVGRLDVRGFRELRI